MVFTVQHYLLLTFTTLLLCVCVIWLLLLLYAVSESFVCFSFPFSFSSQIRSNGCFAYFVQKVCLKLHSFIFIDFFFSLVCFFLLPFAAAAVVVSLLFSFYFFGSFLRFWIFLWVRFCLCIVLVVFGIYKNFRFCLLIQMCFFFLLEISFNNMFWCFEMRHASWLDTRSSQENWRARVTNAWIKSDGKINVMQTETETRNKTKQQQKSSKSMQTVKQIPFVDYFHSFVLWLAWHQSVTIIDNDNTLSAYNLTCLIVLLHAANNNHNNKKTFFSIWHFV